MYVLYIIMNLRGYAISRYLGSASINSSYIRSPIQGPLSTGNSPNTTAVPPTGVLTGVHPNPMRFDPTKQSGEDGMLRKMYRDAFSHTTNNVSINIPSQPVAYISNRTGRQYAVASTMSYKPATDASLYLIKRKAMAVGKSGLKQGLPADAPMAYKSYNTNDVKSALTRVRGGGSVAPKKKGSIYR